MKKYIPNEHGVWLMLLLPAICGIFAVDERELTSFDNLRFSYIPSIAYFFLILVSFILTKPISAIPNPKESFYEYVNGTLLLLIAFTVCAAVMESFSRLYISLCILSPLLIFFIASFFLKVSRSDLLKSIGGLFFPLSAIGGYYSYAGVVDVNAYVLYLLNVMFFFPRSVLAKEYFIEKKRGIMGLAGLFTLISLLFVLFLFVFDYVAVKVLLLYLLFSLPIFLTLLGRYQWDNIRAFGRTEMYMSFIFMLLLINFY